VFGISYSASSLLDLVDFLDADFAGCGIDRKSTFGTCHFLGYSLVCWPLKNNLQLPNPPQGLSMYLLLAATPKSYGMCTP
jgi:hypothetical protein